MLLLNGGIRPLLQKASTENTPDCARNGAGPNRSPCAHAVALRMNVQAEGSGLCAGMPARQFAGRAIVGQPGQHDWGAIGKFSNDAHIATHGLDCLSQRGKQQIAAFFQPRDTVLSDPKSFGDASLRKAASLSEVGSGIPRTHAPKVYLRNRPVISTRGEQTDRWQCRNARTGSIRSP